MPKDVNQFQTNIKQFMDHVLYRLNIYEKENPSIKNDTAYRNMKSSIKRVTELSTKPEKDFLNIRDAFHTLQERSRQCMREIKFSNGLDTRISNDPSKNADLVEDIKNPGQQKLYLMSNNLVSFSERLVDIFDGYYPEKKNEELAAAQAEAREQAEKTLQYYNVIRDYEKKFTDHFVQVKSTDNALYKKHQRNMRK